MEGTYGAHSLRGWMGPRTILNVWCSEISNLSKALPFRSSNPGTGKIFSPKPSTQTLLPIQPHIHWVPAFPPEVKPTGRDADHKPRLRTRGAIPLLNLHGVTAWNGRALPLPHIAAEDIRRVRTDPVQERTACPETKTEATLKPGLESLLTLRHWPTLSRSIHTPSNCSHNLTCFDYY